MRIDAGLTRRCGQCHRVGLLRDVPADGRRCVGCRPPPPRLRLVGRFRVPPRPLPGTLRFHGCPLPHDVVAIQVVRAVRSVALPPRHLARCEAWLARRSLSAAGRLLGVTAQTIRTAVVAALTIMWRVDQRTHPGEVWCEEMEG